MKNTELLLLVNSCLLTLVTFTFVVTGYFLKSLNTGFKNLMERVVHLYSELNTHLKLFETTSEAVSRELEKLDQRLEKLENR